MDAQLDHPSGPKQVDQQKGEGNMEVPGGHPAPAGGLREDDRVVEQVESHGRYR